MLRLICRSFSTKQVPLTPKYFKSSYDALKDVKNGASVVFAGFGVAGVAENCLRVIHERGLRNLNLYSNSMGLPGWGPGAIIDSGQATTLNACFIGGNPAAEKQYLEGKIEIKYMPQGSLVEGSRMLQANIGGFFSPAGVATPLEYGNSPTKLHADGTPEKVSKGCEKFTFNGKEYLLYPPFERSDFCFVKAFIADKFGNLRYRRAARNFNPDIAGCAKITVAEVEHIVDRLPIDSIHTPGCFIDRVFQGEIFTHKVERLTIRYKDEKQVQSKNIDPRQKIVKRAVKEFHDGMFINLGVGIPVEIPSLLPKDSGVILQVENGLVNAGEYPYFDEIDPDTINAIKEPITVKPGFSISSSSTSFGMMRGNHIHMTVLGGLQVSEEGDLANWMVPKKMARGMGGAMDLAACCSRVLVTMEHCAKGTPRILKKCTYPLTAKGCVTKLITEYAVFEFENGKMILKEKVKEISLEELKKMTPAEYVVDPNLKEYQI